MNTKDFETFREELLKECAGLIVTKGADYSGLNDRLRNFKEDGKELGLTPLMFWAVYLRKHLAAIWTYVRQGQVASEPIRSRFVDAINYLILGAALVDEEERDRK
jgi:hypothetical protein